MSTFTPHVEVELLDTRGELDLLGRWIPEVLLRSTPVIDRAAALAEAADMQAEYGAMPHVLCRIHTCDHNEHGQSTGAGCVVETIWETS